MRRSIIVCLVLLYVGSIAGCVDSNSNSTPDSQSNGTVDSMCVETCTAKGETEEVCSAACASTGKDGATQPDPSKGQSGDQGCFDMCIAKGESEEGCRAACTMSDKGDGKEGGDPSVNQECFDACTAKGESDDVCTSACASGDKGGGKDTDSGGKEVPNSTLPVIEFMVDGINHSYRLFVPDSPPAGSMPLLLGFHGGGDRGAAFAQEAQFIELAQSQGIILAFPMSEILPENEGEWVLNTAANSQQDINFINGVIEHISESYSVDASRIYAMGYSLGGMFVYELVCHMSDRFAAVASHAGTMPISPQECEPGRNVSILHLHGVLDSYISYSDTWDWKEWPTVGTMRDVPSLIEFWKNKYACQNEQSSEGSSSVHTVHGMCAQDVRVEHHRLNQVDHEWPSAIEGTSTHEVIWNFLSGFSKP